jgi:hypothetical protein
VHRSDNKFNSYLQSGQYIYKGLTNSSVRGLAYTSLIGRDKLLILDYILHLVGVL